MQSSIRALFPAMLVCLTSACAHHVYSARFNTETWETEPPRVEGVIYYEPTYYKITHEFTERIGEHGNVEKGCTKVIQKEELALMADLKKPRVLLSEPGVLATGQLKVELTNGMLGGLETMSSSLLPALIAPAAPIGAAGFRPDGTKGNTCNASPTIKAITRYEPN